MKSVLGSELKVGDTIKVWWNPNRDTIVKLTPYKGAYANDPEWKDVQFAFFAIYAVGMTIFPDDDFNLITP